MQSMDMYCVLLLVHKLALANGPKYDYLVWSRWWLLLVVIGGCHRLPGGRPHGRQWEERAVASGARWWSGQNHTANCIVMTIASMLKTTPFERFHSTWPYILYTYYIRTRTSRRGDLPVVNIV